MMSYPYAAGRIRALEKKLLNQTDIERMVDAPGFHEAFEVLNDTDFGDNLLNIPARDFHRALDDDLLQKKEFIKAISPDENLFKIIFLKYDFHNIKLFFKAKENKLAEYKTLISSAGVYLAEKIEDYIINGNKKSSPDEEITKVVEKTKKMLKEKKASHEIDQIIDREYFTVVRRLVKRLGNKFIKEYFQRKTDILNLKTAIRVKNMEVNGGLLKDIFIPGGKISLREIIVLAARGEESILKCLKFSLDAGEEKIFSEYLQEKNLWQLEKALDDWSMRYARKAKSITFGPEVIFSYALAKENIFKNIRTIMSARLNNIRAKEIKKHLRGVL